MHIHILGICGTFMGGIAALARQAGHKVTGCDASVYPPMSAQLEAQGISLIEGYAADQAELNPGVFVIGNVVSRGNPLLEEILNRGLPYVSGPQWLAENILRGRWVLAVAGTHGKTTTASMLAWILQHARLEPGFLVGGVPENFGVSARLTGSPFFVVEADEYDTAFFDKRSKFVHYLPKTAVLNNLELDHADIFSDLAAIETQFHHFVRTIPGNGLILANGREHSIARVLARGCWTPVEPFGVPDGWSSDAAEDDSFEVLFRGVPQGKVRWELLGEHNRMNALAAIGAARHAGVPVTAAIEALAGFKSVKRRMQVRGEVNGITVYDDFAHHPTAIATTIAGLRRKVGAARILAVLEPRSNTMRMGVLKDSLAQSLDVADRVFCYAIPELSWDVAVALKPLGGRAQAHADFEQMLEAIVGAASPGDHLLIMSNGSFGGIHEKLLERLKNRR